MTKSDKGGRGSKIGGRPVTYFLNGPIAAYISFIARAKENCQVT